MTNTAETMAETKNTDTDTDIVARYLAVWQILDPDSCAKAVADLWTPDGVEYVEGRQYIGHDALTERVTEAHAAFIATGEYLMGGGEDATRHGDLITFTIRLDRAPDDTAWSARVFLAVSPDGRVREDYQLTVKPLVVD